LNNSVALAGNVFGLFEIDIAIFAGYCLSQINWKNSLQIFMPNLARKFLLSIGKADLLSEA
jgi:hypothetical protein